MKHQFTPAEIEQLLDDSVPHDEWVGTYLPHLPDDASSLPAFSVVLDSIIGCTMRHDKIGAVMADIEDFLAKLGGAGTKLPPDLDRQVELAIAKLKAEAERSPPQPVFTKEQVAATIGEVLKQIVFDQDMEFADPAVDVSGACYTLQIVKLLADKLGLPTESIAAARVEILQLNAPESRELHLAPQSKYVGAAELALARGPIGR